ncbi:type I-E CRISPR-associated protein Cse1/CasA [bacterium]|nr:type I-E CRISPR-associated protein Cse1/CasA [bacterium]
MRLCLRCLTTGMMRVVPWSQSGGRGLDPSVHNAPPVMLLALGRSLLETLGLNLVPFPHTVAHGEAQWSGAFTPTDCEKYVDDWEPVPYMEALTWNPRRILLSPPQTGHDCWRCGATGQDVSTVGKVVYALNKGTNKPVDERTKKKQPGWNFLWHDPSAFYPVVSAEPSAKEQLDARKTMKPTKEALAFSERDLGRLTNEEKPVASLVHMANPDHGDWLLTVPCTDSKAKTFDARSLRLSELTADAFEAARVKTTTPRLRHALAGWCIPAEARRVSWAFLRATECYTDGDWSTLAQAANRRMNESPEAFDLFSGLYWRLRRQKSKVPRRGVAWLVLKLMAAVPARFRTVEPDANWNPLRKLPATQRHSEGQRGKGPLRIYPKGLPGIARLEVQLRETLRNHLETHNPQPVDWPALCDQLNELME